MTLRARILDITPILILFAFVAAFATIVVVEYVVNQPLQATQATQTAVSPGATAP